MMKDYQYLLDELEFVQTQAHVICYDEVPGCAIDQRYQGEWLKLRDYIDAAVSNIKAEIDGGENDIDILECHIFSVINDYNLTANALRNGYVASIADCEEELDLICPLRERARLALEAEYQEKLKYS